MTLGRALNAGTMAGITACLGVTALGYVSSVVITVVSGQGYPIPAQGHVIDLVTGLALTVSIFACMGVLVFSPYAYFREGLKWPGAGDLVVHCSLAAFIGFVVANVFLGGDLRAFLVAFGLFGVGGMAGVWGFRSALLRSTPRVVRPLV